MHRDTTAAAPRDLPAIWAQVRGSVIGLFRSTDPARYAAPTIAGAAEPTVGRSFARIFAAAGGAEPDPGPATADAWFDASTPTDGLARLIVGTIQLEHDIRATLDVPGARDTEAVRLALDLLSDDLSDRILAAGLPPLRVTVEQWGTIAGAGPASRCVVADRFDFVRAMGGRRSVGQVCRWSWGTDPRPYLAVLSERGPLPTQDVRERDPRLPAHMVDFDITGVRSDQSAPAPAPVRLSRIVRGG